jgi:hypothetical protein
MYPKTFRYSATRRRINSSYHSHTSKAVREVRSEPHDSEVRRRDGLAALTYAGCLEKRSWLPSASSGSARYIPRAWC